MIPESSKPVNVVIRITVIYVSKPGSDQGSYFWNMAKMSHTASKS